MQLKKADLEELPVLDLRRLSPSTASRACQTCLIRWRMPSSRGCQVWRTARPANPWTMVYRKSWVCPTWVRFASCSPRSLWCPTGGSRPRCHLAKKRPCPGCRGFATGRTSLLRCPAAQGGPPLPTSHSVAYSKAPDIAHRLSTLGRRCTP